jgi:hypothetical protein
VFALQLFASVVEQGVGLGREPHQNLACRLGRARSRGPRRAF